MYTLKQLRDLVTQLEWVCTNNAVLNLHAEQKIMRGSNVVSQRDAMRYFLFHNDWLAGDVFEGRPGTLTISEILQKVNGKPNRVIGIDQQSPAVQEHLLQRNVAVCNVSNFSYFMNTEVPGLTCTHDGWMFASVSPTAGGKYYFKLSNKFREYPIHWNFSHFRTVLNENDRFMQSFEGIQADRGSMLSSLRYLDDMGDEIQRLTAKNVINVVVLGHGNAIPYAAAGWELIQAKSVDDDIAVFSLNLGDQTFIIHVVNAEGYTAALKENDIATLNSLNTAAQNKQVPLLIHCTQGIDRTGWLMYAMKIAQNFSTIFEHKNLDHSSGQLKQLLQLLQIRRSPCFLNLHPNFVRALPLACAMLALQLERGARLLLEPAEIPPTEDPIVILDQKLYGWREPFNRGPGKREYLEQLYLRSLLRDKLSPLKDSIMKDLESLIRPPAAH